MADDQLMNQEEIERLLSQGSEDAPAGDKPESESKDSKDASSGALDQSQIESLLDQGGGDPPQAAQAGPDPPAKPAPPPQTPPAGDDDDRLLQQEEIEKLLSQAGKSPPSPPPDATSRQTATHTFPEEGSIPQADVDYLLNQAEQALESIHAGDPGGLPAGATSYQFAELAGAAPSTENATLDLICDVELDLKIELGRTHMYLEDVLKLRRGSVVTLDKMAGDPVDIYVNGRLIARGEVLVLNDNFCVRVAELIAGVNAVN